MSGPCDLFIDGAYRSAGGAPFTSTDPVRGDVLWQGNAATADDVEQACRAARAAAPAWYLLGIQARAEILRRFAEQLRARADELAERVARETGKALWDCRGEIAATCGKIELSIRAFHERTGEHHHEEAGTHRQLLHKPHGVVAVFGPFNFPLHLPNGHIVPALLAGNTVVFKPSELAPGCALPYLECLHAAGLPPGVVNLVQGGRETGEALLDNQGIDGVFFTGSAATGRAIHARFAGDTTRILALELGGNNPLVVDAVDDADAAALVICQSAFVSAGQRCSCARRLLVIDTPANREMVARLAQVVDGIDVGDPLREPQPFTGSLIHQRAADAVLVAQQQLLDAGGKVLRACRRVDEKVPILRPGIIDVSGMALADEEVFGPLLRLAFVDDLDQAIAEANRTRYGLSAGILTGDDDHWLRFLSASRAGVVNRNLPLTGASSALPFGGIGDSGNARPGAWYAADYCAWPVASMSRPRLDASASLPPGITL